MREASGHSFKSSLSHTWVRDTRDDKLTSTRGLYTKMYQEVAGIGGDAKFHKIEAEGQLSRALFPGAVRPFRYSRMSQHADMCDYSSGYHSLRVPDTYSR